MVRWMYDVKVKDRVPSEELRERLEVDDLFHDLLLRFYLYHCVWSVITAHNLTPEKRDNNYSPHPLTPTTGLRSTFKL